MGAIDDATGTVTAATFRDQEDTAGYLEVLAGTIRRHGVPGAVYHDRHGIFEPSLKTPLTLEEQLVDVRVPTQLGRAFAELGIGSIAARSPQAKGRVERLWGTLQDRLVAELRIAGIDDRDAADAFLAGYLPRFNDRFAVPAADPVPAWRPVPAWLTIERVCCLKYRRTVARDGTVRAGATILRLPPRANGRSRAGQRVELHLRLDGRMVVWDGAHELVTTPAPLDAVQLRALNACDWVAIMAQYPDDAEIHLSAGQVVKGREAIGELFAGFVLPAEEGGLCGITFTEESRLEVGTTENVQWVAEADFLAEPYRGSDAYVTDGRYMAAMVSTFEGTDLVMAEAPAE